MSLFASLIATSGSLRAYDNSLSVIQNNVANANSPGFARQRVAFIPKKFDIQQGLSGGVDTGALISSRDAYSERNVWHQSNSYGRFSQQAADLEQVEPVFTVTKDSGVPGALNKFFNGISSWSINPNDPVARQLVLDRADGVARAFNENANAIGETKNSVDRQIRDTITHINSLVHRLGDLNGSARSDRGAQSDPALDAAVYSTLQELSELADFNALKQPDGSVTVLFGGQTPLVIGDRVRELRADFSTQPAQILNDEDEVVTGQLSDGALKGLLDTRGTLLPSYETELNTLAESFAQRVNGILNTGVDQNGSPPPFDLFTFDPFAAAATLKTNPLDPSQLAGAESGAPGGNANILKLAALANSQEINGASFSQFYGQLGARVGRDLSKARAGKDLQADLVNQANTLREERSGVSLDEEAARLIEAQRAYQANAQLFSVLNSMTDTLIGLLK